MCLVVGWLYSQCVLFYFCNIHKLGIVMLVDAVCDDCLDTCCLECLNICLWVFFGFFFCFFFLLLQCSWACFTWKDALEIQLLLMSSSSLQSSSSSLSSSLILLWCWSPVVIIIIIIIMIIVMMVCLTTGWSGSRGQWGKSSQWTQILGKTMVTGGNAKRIRQLVTCWRCWGQYCARGHWCIDLNKET